MGAHRCVPLPHRIDVARTLGPLRVGRHDPTTLLGADTVLRAMRTPDGPATLRAERTGDRFDVDCGEREDGDGRESPAAGALSASRPGAYAHTGSVPGRQLRHT